MSTNRPEPDTEFDCAYERGMLRSAFVSLFRAVITERKKRGDFTLQGLAKTLGTNKAEVSRWFNGDPNWTVNTISNLAHALDVDVEIRARDRRSPGIVFTPGGPTGTERPATPSLPLKGIV